MTDFHVYAFDSCRGLSPKRRLKDHHKEWREGSFRTTLDELKKQIKALRSDPKAANTHFSPGYFELTLTNDLRDQVMTHGPLTVTINVEYYSSTSVLIQNSVWMNALETQLHKIISFGLLISNPGDLRD